MSFLLIHRPSIAGTRLALHQRSETPARRLAGADERKVDGDGLGRRRAGLVHATSSFPATCGVLRSGAVSGFGRGGERCQCRQAQW